MLQRSKILPVASE